MIDKLKNKIKIMTTQIKIWKLNWKDNWTVYKVKIQKMRIINSIKMKMRVTLIN